MSPYALDLTRHHFCRTLGDITLYGTWWLADDSGPRPCLVLIPTHKQRYDRAMPCVVLLNDAWRWDERIGDGVHVARECAGFIQALGMTPCMSNAFKLRSLIHDHIDDLLSIPPMPADMREGEMIGEVTVIDRETGRTIEHELTDGI